jgi:hypothetical protein
MVLLMSTFGCRHKRNSENNHMHGDCTGFVLDKDLSSKATRHPIETLLADLELTGILKYAGRGHRECPVDFDTSNVAKTWERDQSAMAPVAAGRLPAASPRFADGTRRGRPG